MIVLVLPYPPSVNTYWRNIGKGRTIISEKGRKYRDTVAKLLDGHDSIAWKSIAVRIDVYCPDRRIRDLDNIPKSVLDAITNAGIWQDDSLIDDLRLVRKQIEKPGKVIVTISEILRGV